MSETEKNPIPNDLKRIRIDALLSYGNQYILDIYLRLSEEKFVKVADKASKDECVQVLEKYKGRGLGDVYLPLSDYNYFITSVRQNIVSHFKKSNGLKEDQPLLNNKEADPKVTALALKSSEVPPVLQLSGAHAILKSLLAQDNLEPDTLELAQSIAIGTLKTIKSTNLLSSFNDFRRRCGREFTCAIITGQITCLMIDQFNWSKDTIKEKVALASMLCDVDLRPEDFDQLKDFEGDKKTLSKKILFHPLEIATKLAKESKFFSQETLQIIEQHHELPSGNGFPKGLNYQRIGQLPAIFIVAQYYVDQMFDKTYREDGHQERSKIVIEQIKNKFVSGVFRKASEALAVVIPA